MSLLRCAGRVLVADDEAEVCLYLKRYLERKKYHVVCVQDGHDAKKTIEGETFDCFFLDCSMPNVTGLELIQAARTKNPSSKIVLMSGFPAVDAKAAQRFGSDAFLHKPLRITEVERVLTKQTQEGKDA